MDILHPRNLDLDDDQKRKINQWAKGDYATFNKQMNEFGATQISCAVKSDTTRICAKVKVKSIADKLLTCFQPFTQSDLESLKKTQGLNGLEQTQDLNGLEQTTHIVAYRSQTQPFNGNFVCGNTHINMRFTATVAESQFARTFGAFQYKVLIPLNTPLIIMKRSQIINGSKEHFTEILLPPGLFDVEVEAIKSGKFGELIFSQKQIFQVDHVNKQIAFNYTLPSQSSPQSMSSCDISLQFADDDESNLPEDVFFNCDNIDNLNSVLSAINNWLDDKDQEKDKNELDNTAKYLNAKQLKTKDDELEKTIKKLNDIKKLTESKKGGGTFKFFLVKTERLTKRKYIVYKRKKKYLDEHRGQYRYDHSKTRVRLLARF